MTQEMTDNVQDNGVDLEQVKQAIQETFILDEMLETMREEDGLEPDPSMIKSRRGKMWQIFNDEMVTHIENYAVSQYGDFPDDQVTKWTEADLKKQIEKYLNRMDSGERGRIERDRDLLKIAHYAQLIWAKRLGFEEAFTEILAEQEKKD